MDRDTKLEALYYQLNELIKRFGKVQERYSANMNEDDNYLERPMPVPEQEKNQDVDNEQGMYDVLKPMEDEEESN